MPFARRVASLLILLGSSFAARALTSEDYEVYSVVLDGFSTHTGNPQIALASDLLNPASVKPSPGACGAPPIAGVPARTGDAERLDERKLRLSRPYKLLTKEEVAQWSAKRFLPQVHTDPPGPEPPDPYPGSHDLVQLSGIVYSADHNTAAVYVSDTCGTLCGIWGWAIIQKSRDRSWRMLSSLGCATIA